MVTEECCVNIKSEVSPGHKIPEYQISLDHLLPKFQSLNTKLIKASCSSTTVATYENDSEEVNVVANV